MPLVNMNRQISSIDQSLKGLSSVMQDIRQRIKSVVEYASINLTNTSDSVTMGGASSTLGLTQRRSASSSSQIQTASRF